MIFIQFIRPNSLNELWATNTDILEKDKYETNIIIHWIELYTHWKICDFIIVIDHYFDI